MEYGTQESTKVTDANGSTETIVENIKAGEVIHPVRKKIRQRVRVSNQTDEQTEYYNFSNQISHDKSMLDTSFEIEKNSIGNKQGFYYVIKCWTQIKY